LHTYDRKKIRKKIRQTLKRSPSVALLGLRQVGKTTLAFRISETIPAVYLDLEDRLDLQKVGDVQLFHAENREKLIILDEIQRLPEIFSPLRSIIDKERRKGNKAGQFLFLGSASLDLLKQLGEPLAGRIAYLELFSIDLLEHAQELGDQTLLQSMNSGYGVDFPKVCWLLLSRIAWTGEEILSRPIWSVISLSWAPGFRQKHWSASGPCWPTTRAHNSMPPS